jgi:DNA-binding CsgD family transcriptional regulator
VIDVLRDMSVAGLASLRDWHTGVELLAVLSLLGGIALGLRMLLALLARQKHLERDLSIASGALHEVIARHFDDWGLTPSERDVAGFTLKGLPIAEVARLRGSAEGTVKAHLSAIYRKAGVSGRGQLVSLLIEDLLAGPLVGKDLPRPEAEGGTEATDAAPSGAPGWREA